MELNFTSILRMFVIWKNWIYEKLLISVFVKRFEAIGFIQPETALLLVRVRNCSLELLTVHSFEWTSRQRPKWTIAYKKWRALYVTTTSSTMNELYRLAIVQLADRSTGQADCAVSRPDWVWFNISETYNLNGIKKWWIYFFWEHAYYFSFRRIQQNEIFFNGDRRYLVSQLHRPDSLYVNSRHVSLWLNCSLYSLWSELWRKTIFYIKLSG